MVRMLYTVRLDVDDNQCNIYIRAKWFARRIVVSLDWLPGTRAKVLWLWYKGHNHFEINI